MTARQPSPTTTTPAPEAMTTHTNDPITKALDLLEQFNEELIGADGEGRIAEMDATAMNEYLMRAINLQCAVSARRSDRSARLAELALRHLVEWTADERDRRQALLEQLNRSLPGE